MQVDRLRRAKMVEGKIERGELEGKSGRGAGDKAGEGSPKAVEHDGDGTGACGDRGGIGARGGSAVGDGRRSGT